MVFCPTLPHNAPLFATAIDFGQSSERKIFAFFQRKTPTSTNSDDSVCLGFRKNPFGRGIRGRAITLRCIKRSAIKSFVRGRKTLPETAKIR